MYVAFFIFTFMKWEKQMQEKLEAMAYQNEQLLLRAGQSWHLLPPGFCEQIRELTLQIVCLQKFLIK